MSAGSSSLGSAAVYPEVLAALGLDFEPPVPSAFVGGREKAGALLPAAAPARAVAKDDGAPGDEQQQQPSALLVTTTPSRPAIIEFVDDGSGPFGGKDEGGRIEGTSTAGDGSGTDPHAVGSGSITVSNSERRSLSPARQCRRASAGGGGGGGGSSSSRLSLTDEDLVLPEPCREEGLSGDEQASEVADVLHRCVMCVRVRVSTALWSSPFHNCYFSKVS